MKQGADDRKYEEINVNFKRMRQARRVKQESITKRIIIRLCNASSERISSK
jgi:hypothetical protein